MSTHAEISPNRPDCEALKAVQLDGIVPLRAISSNFDLFEFSLIARVPRPAGTLPDPDDPGIIERRLFKRVYDGLGNPMHWKRVK